MNDWELLQAWAAHRSEAAFAQLVERHLGFVHASARRQMADASLAEDVTQAVFLLLARKAGSLGPGVILPGWLFRTTRFVAARALRTEHRRQDRELQAATMNQSTPDEAADPGGETWKEIEPQLDAAVATLAPTDRDAILLRFFQRKSLRDVGGALGVSEEAAKKRVSRAVEKLRERLGRRGVVTNSVVLTGLLAVPVAEAVPVTLAARIQAAAGKTAQSASTTAGILADGAARDWFWSRMVRALPWAAAALMLVLGTGRWLTAGSRDWDATGPRLSVASPSAAPEVGNPEATAAAGASAPSSGRQLRLTVVASEDRHPLVDARLLAVFYSRSGGQRQDLLAVNRDGDGVVLLPDDALDLLRVWVSAPGRVPKVMDWRSYEFTDPLFRHTCQLELGQTFTGDVRDETGQPVAAAQVVLSGPGSNRGERENVGFHSRLTPVASDGNGHFRIDQIPARFGGSTIGVTVRHPDYSYAKFWLSDPAQLATNFGIVLRRGVPLAGRVVGPGGAPVVEAQIETYPQQIRPNPEATTDVDGRFELAHLEPGPVRLSVHATGYQDLERTVLTGTNTSEVALELQFEGPTRQPAASRALHLSGTVVDDETGALLESFRVISQQKYSEPVLLGEGRDGGFAWDIDESPFEPVGSLVVEADGYQPEVSVSASASDHRSYSFRLKRDAGIAGWVYQPDGRPAAGAEVSLAGDGFGLLLNEPGRLMTGGFPVNRTVTDDQGHFSLHSQAGALRVVMVHPGGCRVLPVSSVTNVAVRLEAWGEIEGVLLSGGRPLTNGTVNVGSASPSYGPDDLRIGFDYNTKSDAQGRFHFTGVPPGDHYVQRLLNLHEGRPGAIGYSQGVPVTVKPGEPAEVVVGGAGRAVTGRLVLSRPVVGYDWNRDLQALVLDRPGLKAPERRRSSEGSEIRAQRLQFFAWSAYNLACRKYYLTIQPDGSFRVEDVPAGNYGLKLEINAPPADPLSEESEFPRAPIGRLTRAVIIQEAAAANPEEPVDLGTLTIPIERK